MVVESYSRRAPAHHRLDRCVFVQELTGEYGTLFSVGEVLISSTRADGAANSLS